MTDPVIVAMVCKTFVLVMAILVGGVVAIFKL